jgi:hypothetical protein
VKQYYQGRGGWTFKNPFDLTMDLLVRQVEDILQHQDTHHLADRLVRLAVVLVEELREPILVDAQLGEPSTKKGSRLAMTISSAPRFRPSALGAAAWLNAANTERTSCLPGHCRRILIESSFIRRYEGGNSNVR